MNAVKKVFLKTFGCQMNVYDSERIYRFAEAQGYQRAQCAEDADLVIINTCSVREKPEHKAVSEIGWIHKRIRKDPNVKIGLAGCVAQQMGDQLLAKIPHLSMVIGTGAIGRLPEILKRVDAGERVADCEIGEDSLIGMPEWESTWKSDSRATAFVSIMRGCNNFCSYCIVPYVRGPERSRDPDKIVAEIRSLIDSGVVEVTLLGQNVNSYGANLNPKIPFVDLLEKVHEIPGLSRLRFITSHPKDISTELIGAFAELPKLAGQIHLPVQSGSDRILRLMNRGYTVSQYLEKVNALRNIRPDIALSSDIIVGFCGETDEDFQSTLGLLETVRFDNLFSFMYSERPGTKAAGTKDDVPLELKKARLAKLQATQNQITHEQNQVQQGKVMEVIVEGDSRGGIHRKSGRTTCNRIVHFDDPDAKVGQRVLVRITQGFQNALVGRLEKEVE